MLIGESSISNGCSKISNACIEGQIFKAVDTVATTNARAGQEIADTANISKQ